MCNKLDFLWRLSHRVELAENQADQHPGDQKLRAYAQSLRTLHDDLSKLPASHRVFENWKHQEWEPLAMSDLPTESDSRPGSVCLQ
jgi:hypothetical protein